MVDDIVAALSERSIEFRIRFSSLVIFTLAIACTVSGLKVLTAAVTVTRPSAR